MKRKKPLFSLAMALAMGVFFSASVFAGTIGQGTRTTGKLMLTDLGGGLAIENVSGSFGTIPEEMSSAQTVTYEGYIARMRSLSVYSEYGKGSGTDTAWTQGQGTVNPVKSIAETGGSPVVENVGGLISQNEPDKMIACGQCHLYEVHAQVHGMTAPTRYAASIDAADLNAPSYAKTAAI